MGLLIAARQLLVTVVTPDLDASLGFYRDGLGYEPTDRGVLAAGAGHGLASRGYAVLRQRVARRAPGVVRLISAPAGARANRPRGQMGALVGDQAGAMDEGLAAVVLICADDAKAHRDLTEAGVELLSWPQFGQRERGRPNPAGRAVWDRGDIEFKAFSAFGPAGEMLTFMQGLSQAGQAWPDWDEPASDYVDGGGVVITRDRWPLFDAYAALTGTPAGPGGYMAQDPVNTALGAAPGTYFHYGALADGLGVEWREYRAVAPAPHPRFPTSLDRTGLAMITLTVADPAGARSRAEAAGLAVLGEGALPTGAGEIGEGFIVRGAVGELIEIVGG